MINSIYNTINPIKSLINQKRLIHLSSKIYRHHATPLKKIESNSSSKQVNVLTCKRSADSIASILSKHVDISNSNSVIFDTYPGYGNLSTSLLKSGANRIIAWEPRDKYWSDLKVIEKKYDSRFLVKHKCFLRSKRYSLTPASELDKRIFHLLTPRQWSDECNLTVIGGTSTIGITMYISSLVYSLSKMSGVSHYGRVQHYLLLTGMEAKILHDLDLHWKKMTITRVLFYKIFFDFEIIEKIPLSSFTPNTISQGWKYMEWDAGNMYLTRLSIKEDVFSTVCEQKHIAILLDMLGELNKRKHERVIPLLDHWFPGFGVELLRRGYSMLDRVKYIPMDEIIDIYKCILANPLYLNSSFGRAVFKDEYHENYEDIEDDFLTTHEDIYPNKI